MHPKENVIVVIGFSLMRRSEAICLIIESLIMMAEGEKLNVVPEGVGAELLQFTAQHKRAIFASFDCSLLFAFLQQSIIWLFSFPE